MRSFTTFIVTSLVAFAAIAQTYSNAPMVVVGEGAQKPAAAAAPVPGAEFPNFPENAITRVGENTMGQHLDAPANPATPAAPAAGTTPASPANPASPASPPSPISKLWPKDTIKIFMPPCTGLKVQYVPPCTCVITQLIVQMPHDEFLKKSEDGTLEQDPRLMKIRTDCATAPAKKD